MPAFLSRTVTCCVSVLLMLHLSACGDDQPVEPVLSYETVFESAGPFPDVEERELVVDSSTTTELIGNENWVCTTKTFDVTKAPEEFALFDPNAEVVFPGNMLQGQSLERPTPDPIPVRRGPGTIVLTLMNGAGMGVSRTVPEVTLSNVYDAANEVISQNPGDVPARFSFTMERVDSEQQLALAANMSASFWGGSVAASLKFSTNRRYNRFLVKLTQSFYTIAHELPTDYDAMFGPDVTPEQLAQYVGPGNPAAFISSVTYGRIFYLLIESTERVDSMSASINASFAGWKAGASGKYVGSLENLVVKAFALGGNASDALSAVTDDFDSLKAFLAEGGTITTGVPISYVVRSVRHPEKVVKVARNTQYDVTDCNPIFETFGEPVVWLMADDPNLEFSGTDATRLVQWPDVSGNDNYAFLDAAVPDSMLPQFMPDAVNGEMPAVQFGEGSTMRILGNGLSNTDYTLVAVTALDIGLLETRPLYFIGGSTLLSGHMVRAGLLSRDSVYDPFEYGFNHYNDGVRTDRLPNPAEYHLYTMVFSEDRGMSIYIDGREVAWEPLATEPVRDFFGARIGNVTATPNASVNLAELLAFKVALTDDQRRYLEDNLMRKYKF
ncbi:MAG: thiol-activated cytolysin family protein [Gemmatimonadales bacterium]|jgi:hypothetical protein